MRSESRCSIDAVSVLSRTGSPAIARNTSRIRKESARPSAMEWCAQSMRTERSAPCSSVARNSGALDPDILVLCGGSFPPTAPLYKQTWQEFSANWEADVKIAFNFFKAALSRPLPVGTSVILVSSGAALAGSPLTGGYAGAKRTQLFMANYSQKESDRLELGLRFLAIAPRIILDTELGKRAIAGYSNYLGITEADFIRSMAAPPNSSDAASAVIALATNPERFKENVFVVSGKGLEAVSL